MNAVVKTVRSKIQDRRDIIAIAKQEIDDLTRVCVDVEAFYDNFGFVSVLNKIDVSDGREYLECDADISEARARRYKDGATGTVYIFILIEVSLSVFQVIVLTEVNFVSFCVHFTKDPENFDEIFQQAIDKYVQIKFGL